MEEAVRLNIGCGSYPMVGFVNIDCNPELASVANLIATVPPLPWGTGTVTEIYAGHFLEHLTLAEAEHFLSECKRVLMRGGKLGVVIPDTREVMKRYLDPSANGRIEYPLGKWNDVHDMNTICSLFLYSTVQETPHKWSYDLVSLRSALCAAGFAITGEINRWMDSRIPVGAWYQCGLDAVVRS